MPSVIAITTGGIMNAKNIPATKLIIHKPPDFFTKPLKNTVTPPALLNIVYEHAKKNVTNPIDLMNFLLYNVYVIINAGMAQLVAQLIRNAVRYYEKVAVIPMGINTCRVLILLKMNIC